MALSGLCGASVRGCQIPAVHTVALCLARGRISMGPLMGHPRPFIVHLAREHGAWEGGGGGVRGGHTAQHLAGMQNHVHEPKQKPLCEAFIGN